MQLYEHTVYVPEVCWNQADITGSNILILSQFWCYARFQSNLDIFLCKGHKAKGQDKFFQSSCTALMAGNLLAIRAVQGDCQWLLSKLEIPTSLVSPESIMTEAIPTYNYTNQSQMGDASHLMPMSHTLLTIRLTPVRLWSSLGSACE